MAIISELLSTVVDSQRLSTREGRFQWCTAWKRDSRSESHDWVKKPCSDSSQRTEDVPMPFYYLLDNATNDLYQVNHPSSLPICFFCSVVLTPVIFCLAVMWNVAKFALAMFSILDEVFNEACDIRSQDKFVLTSLDSFEKKVQACEEMLIKPFQLIAAEFKYAAAMELASLNGFVHLFQNEEMFKMLVVIAEIESLRNDRINYRHTPFSHAARFEKEIENLPLQNRFEYVINSITHPQLDHVEWAFYLLQYFQSRGNTNEIIGSGQRHRKFEIRERFRDYEAYVEYRRSHPVV